MPSTRHVKPKRRKGLSDYQFNLETFEGGSFPPSVPYVSKVEFEELRVKVGELEGLRVKVGELEKMVKEGEVKQVTTLEELPFPPEVLDKLPKPLKRVVEGIKMNFERDFPDFCCMGMRKALSIGIDIRFEKDGKYDKLFDSGGAAYNLPKRIELAKQEKYLSSSLATKLRKEAKVFGDVALHDHKIDLKKEEVPSIFKLLRLALGRMYYEES